jgi:hypothetical protein
MKITRKGIQPDLRPDWEKRLDTLRLYVNNLELCLEAANRRIKELEEANALLRRNAKCPYEWVASPEEAAKGAGNG